jgi:hypothetical protein
VPDDVHVVEAELLIFVQLVGLLLLVAAQDLLLFASHPVFPLFK